MTASVTLRTDLIDNIDKELSQLPLLKRMPAIKGGLRKACDVVRSRVREVLPKPGYPGDDDTTQSLSKAVSTTIKEYANGNVLGMVGYAWGQGSHGHLIEEGHRIVISRGKRKGDVAGNARAFHYLKTAARATESEQAAVMQDAVEKAISETKRG